MRDQNKKRKLTESEIGNRCDELTPEEEIMPENLEGWKPSIKIYQDATEKMIDVKKLSEAVRSSNIISSCITGLPTPINFDEFNSQR